MKPIKPQRFLLLNLLSVKLAEHTLSLSYVFGLYCLELHCLFCLELNCLFCLFSIAEKEYGFIEDVEKNCVRQNTSDVEILKTRQNIRRPNSA